MVPGDPCTMKAFSMAESNWTLHFFTILARLNTYAMAESSNHTLPTSRDFQPEHTRTACEVQRLFSFGLVADQFGIAEWIHRGTAVQ